MGQAGKRLRLRCEVVWRALGINGRIARGGRLALGRMGKERNTVHMFVHSCMHSFIRSLQQGSTGAYFSQAWPLPSRGSQTHKQEVPEVGTKTGEF